MYPDGYSLSMNELNETEEFSGWLAKLKDPIGKASIIRRIKRARKGNFGDHESVGGNVSEMRLFTGPGYRLYYTMVEDQVYWLLVGGDKSTQDKDIERAKEMATDIRGEKR